MPYRGSLETCFYVISTAGFPCGVCIPKVEKFALFIIYFRMSKSRVQKAGELETLVQAFKNAKSVAFADYQGMTVAKMTDLRKKLFASHVEYVVTKKTLLSLAAKQAGYDMDVKSLPGMLSAAFAKEDEMAPAKVIGDAGKDQPIKLVGGIFDGKTIDRAYIIALSTLPSRPQLLGQLLSVMNGPMSAFARLLNAYKEQKEGGVSAVSAGS